jgi:hypothetical protein
MGVALMIVRPLRYFSDKNEKIETPLASIKKTDMNKAPRSGWF